MTNEKSNSRSRNKGQASNENQRKSQKRSKKSNAQGSITDVPEEAPVKEDGRKGIDSGNEEPRNEYDGGTPQKAASTKQAQKVSVNAAGVQSYDQPQAIDYSGATEQPLKPSATIPPSGRTSLPNPFVGEPIAAPSRNKGLDELWIENKRSGTRQKVTKEAWRQMSQGAAGDWKALDPEEPQEVTNLKNKKQ